MYLDFKTKIPDVPGKITRTKKGEVYYINYEYGRVYYPDKKYNVPKRAVIGKCSGREDTMMIPNEIFLKYFGDVELPERKNNSARSSCLRIGAFLVIRRIIEEYKLNDFLKRWFDAKECGLFLDLCTYSILCEDNAGQYYPDYAYNHPLFTEKMHIYSDSKVSAFLSGITDDQSVGFLNGWNAARDHRERIYISYDSTNKHCQAGDIEIAEFGHDKEGQKLPIINYSVAYDTHNREPLFYEEYPGSIVDISQLDCMLEKAKGYGYRNIGFILDRGYFSKDNIRHLDRCGYDFVIMMKGMAKLVKDLVTGNKGSFENSRSCGIRRYKCYGKTVCRKMFETDEAERSFHLYYSICKEAKEKEQLETKLDRMQKAMGKWRNKAIRIPDSYRHYYHIETDPKDGVFLYAREKEDVIEQEVALCGYFVIITSRKMTAKEAIELYKSRDASEKLFRGDKSYLGNRSMRVYTDESVSAKIFIEFVALIIRCRIYTLLKDEKEKMESAPNYMTVPAAMKELEKIELVRGADGKYRLDHAVTKHQKLILGAFRMDANYVRNKAAELSSLIGKCEDGIPEDEEESGEEE